MRQSSRCGVVLSFERMSRCGVGLTLLTENVSQCGVGLTVSAEMVSRCSQCAVGLSAQNGCRSVWRWSDCQLKMDVGQCGVGQTVSRERCE